MSGVATAILRLGPLIRLLGSDQAGEVSAAVGGLRRVLAANDLDLNDFAAWLERMASQDAVAHNEHWGDVAAAYRQRGAGVLGDRDLNFLHGIEIQAARGQELSEKQLKWMDDIERKVRVSARNPASGRRAR